MSDIDNYAIENKHYKDKEKASGYAVGWMYDKLLQNEMRLSDVPQCTRIAGDGIYSAAFRVSQYLTEERYVEDLVVMAKDVSVILDDVDYWRRDSIINDFGFYLRVCDLGNEPGQCRGDGKKIEAFRKGLSKRLQRELSESEGLRAAQLRAEFEKYGLIPTDSDSE